NAMGFSALAIGINAAVSNMPKSQYPVLFILSLAIGSFLGAKWDWDGKFQRLSTRLGHSELGRGLATAILLFCIGTLSILGPIESAVNGNNTFLFTNATLDFVTSMVLASTYGIGIAFSAAVLFCWQGSLYLLGLWLGTFVPQALMAEVSVVGGILIMISGVSMLKIKDCRTLNMLPALFVSVVLYFLAETFM
ncbi:MAG: DUF554 domain-containing protein, partial [Mailhella sp.]|nr:DUF554 domain-containing protein [Mailhella sp.]